MPGLQPVRIVTDVVQDCLPRAMDKHIDLGYEGASASTPGVWLNGNATLLAELVRNLVDNAINYTPSTSEQPGVVTARAGRSFRPMLLLQVEDSGPGVPLAERELIFQPFYRALGSEADGSGLGLPIVMEIARQHGAQVLLQEPGPVIPRRGAVYRALQGHARTAVKRKLEMHQFGA
jgi:two-component system sensor histidine kinase TctE